MVSALQKGGGERCEQVCILVGQRPLQCMVKIVRGNSYHKMWNNTRSYIWGKKILYCSSLNIFHFACFNLHLKLGKLGKWHGNSKRESVVAAILPSRKEVSYCTSGFFRS